ncbi:MAG: hypothetical protein WD023_08435 [Ilumatobacteraceae bacterium]
MAWVRLALAVAGRPTLWPTALRQLRRTAPPGWWKHAPFLPVPSGPYLRFRLVTQYGSPDHPPIPDDVLNYLVWCRRQGSR